MKVLVIYDDTVLKSELINDIIGNKGFSDVIVKRRRIESYYKENVSRIYPEMSWITVRSAFEFNGLAEKIELDYANDYRIIHCFSNFIFSDFGEAELSFKKLEFIKHTYKVCCGKYTAALFFANTDDYKAYLKRVCRLSNSVSAAKEIKDSFRINGLTNIAKVENFIQCISGNFDSRYFNSLGGDEYTLVKSSTNKTKIKSEYTYYHLLPDEMKMWFVMPFNYTEDAEKASYTMERLHITDLAIKWVHGSIDKDEFSDIMDKYFYFLSSRHKKSVSAGQYQKTADALYIDKVKSRISTLKKKDAFQKIQQVLSSCNSLDIDDLVNRYLELKKRVEKTVRFRHEAVIGHGDPCFANTMYNKATKTLKFIDPKGALSEEELWTDPYYDVAKLSHSVCGRYDFFNNALFEIKIYEDFTSRLTIDFDNSEYVEIFKEKLAENGYDYLAVRLYEASLFLSMLPLHIDYPHKVYGFILNAVDILDEIENELDKKHK